MKVPALAAAAVLAIGGYTLAGCRSAPGQPMSTGLPTHTLRVGLIEWSIQVQARPLAPGPDRFLVTNAGTTAHDLRVSGSGTAAQTSLLAPGSSTVLAVATTAGERLTLTCTVPGHEAQGMLTHITVAQEG